MTDRELSTSDLAETSETGAANADDERVRVPSDADAQAEPSAASGPVEERAAEDEPSLRERSETGDERSDPASGPAVEQPDSLLPDEQAQRFVTRWQEIQTAFVDEPRESVAEADALVADLMQRLAASFSDEREGLEAQWDRGEDVSTEDLRVALKRYRSFFDRLLAA